MMMLPWLGSCKRRNGSKALNAVFIHCCCSCHHCPLLPLLLLPVQLVPTLSSVI